MPFKCTWNWDAFNRSFKHTSEKFGKAVSVSPRFFFSSKFSGSFLTGYGGKTVDWIWIYFPTTNTTNWYILIVYTNTDNVPIGILGCFFRFWYLRLLHSGQSSETGNLVFVCLFFAIEKWTKFTYIYLKFNIFIPCFSSLLLLIKY